MFRRRRSPFWDTVRELQKEQFELTPATKGMAETFAEALHEAIETSSNVSQLFDFPNDDEAEDWEWSVATLNQCISSYFRVLALTEYENTVVMMMTYGLLKADDLQAHLHASWRSYFVTALRYALKGVRDEEKAHRCRQRLRSAVSKWWSEADADSAYERFKQRGSVRDTLAKASVHAKELSRRIVAKERRAADSGVRPAPYEDDEQEELASI